MDFVAVNDAAVEARRKGATQDEVIDLYWQNYSSQLQKLSRKKVFQYAFTFGAGHAILSCRKIGQSEKE